MKLSIVVPMYNVAEYVHKTAESIIGQNFDGLEVILIDDGSTDNSLEICKNLLAGVNTVTIRQENTGLSGARNAGIWAATGDYVLLLDGDDFLLPNALELVCNLLENTRPDVLFGRYLRWSPATGFSKNTPYDFRPPSDPKRRTEYILGALPEPTWNAWRYVCRRDFLIDNGLFFERNILCEDVPWTLKLLETAKTIEFLQEPFYGYYHRRPQSIMNQLNPKRLVDLNASVKALVAEYADRPAICTQLVWQSFLYINEYCVFRGQERRLVWERYCCVLPMYGYSESRLHRMVGKCSNSVLFYCLSVGLFFAKCVRKVWRLCLHR